MSHHKSAVFTSRSHSLHLLRMLHFAAPANKSAILAQIALLAATAGCELCFALLAVWEELHLRKHSRVWQMEAARMPSLASLLLDDSSTTGKRLSSQ